MATSTTFPAPYVPRVLPSLPDPGNAYLMKELRAIQETLNGALDMLPQSATAAPSRPRAGMMRLSQAPWRPVVGQVSDRWVTYTSGAWVYSSTL